MSPGAENLVLHLILSPLRGHLCEGGCFDTSSGLSNWPGCVRCIASGWMELATIERSEIDSCRIQMNFREILKIRKQS